MTPELMDLFRKALRGHELPYFSRAVPMAPFFMSLATVVNGWKQGRNELTGRVYWYNRQGRVRVAPP